MNNYLVIDGMLNGTGIRDPYETGYIEPEKLGLSDGVIKKLRDWLRRYANQHFEGYSDKRVVAVLDLEGIEISKLIKNELPESKISYFSDALMSKIDI